MTGERFDLIVRGGTVAGAGAVRPLDIAVRAGRIVYGSATASAFSVKTVGSSVPATAG